MFDAATLMKALGIDPDEVKGSLEGFVSLVKQIDQRLSNIQEVQKKHEENQVMVFQALQTMINFLNTHEVSNVNTSNTIAGNGATGGPA